MDNIKDILDRIKKYVDGAKEKAEATYGIYEMKRTMNESNDYIADKGAMLDIGVVYDHPKKLYQIQLYATNIQTTNTVIAVLPPQSLERVLLDLQRHAMVGYLPTGDGTNTPGVRLPCEAEQMMEKWK